MVWLYLVVGSPCRVLDSRVCQRCSYPVFPSWARGGTKRQSPEMAVSLPGASVTSCPGRDTPVMPLPSAVCTGVQLGFLARAGPALGERVLLVPFSCQRRQSQQDQQAVCCSWREPLGLFHQHRVFQVPPMLYLRSGHHSFLWLPGAPLYRRTHSSVDGHLGCFHFTFRLL